MPNKSSYTFVSVISSKGKSSLVEYVEAGIAYRVYVPAHQVKERLVSNEILASGIPYGHPWDEIKIDFDMKQFLSEMHNANLWTVEDVLRSPAKVTGVLRKVFEPSLKAILETAKQAKRS